MRARCSADIDLIKQETTGLNIVIELRDGFRENILAGGASVDLFHEAAPFDEVAAVLQGLLDVAKNT